MNEARIWYKRSKLKAKKSANIYTAQKLISFVICYKPENFDSDFGHFFSQTRVKNRVTMATA